ncbi:HEPN domain-containing protein [Pedobacter sp. HMF7647]|uniref:HEPN domain-containing protein n=1 Tax=Hufsiella arboris TaxID=2695275 RepID=A0A7K1YCZ5_9SPHI|nr:HEPN domain-containing protein [Hufsiella arboris]MXV52462.1 HEPN domain-containing protein [Hufsiella arboris]
MNGHPLTLSILQYKSLQEITGLLANRYQPEGIICFGYKNRQRQSAGCFASHVNSESCHYFLLLITKENARIEHEVQEFVDHRYRNGKLTILAHGKETVGEGIARGNLFFTSVCRYGFQLYSSSGLCLCFDYPEENFETNLAECSSNAYQRLEMASSFLTAAEKSLYEEHYAACLFLLHQVVEQACLALIRLFMAYRADTHNLSRLLELTECFSESAAYFPRELPEDQRLFRMLMKSYSDCRYKDAFEINDEDAQSLFKRVSGFFAALKSLCHNRLEDETAKENVQEQVFSALPVGSNSTENPMVHVPED